MSHWHKLVFEIGGKLVGGLAESIGHAFGKKTFGGIAHGGTNQDSAIAQSLSHNSEALRSLADAQSGLARVQQEQNKLKQAELMINAVLTREQLAQQADLARQERELKAQLSELWRNLQRELQQNDLQSREKLQTRQIQADWDKIKLPTIFSRQELEALAQDTEHPLFVCAKMQITEGCPNYFRTELTAEAESQIKKFANSVFRGDVRFYSRFFDDENIFDTNAAQLRSIIPDVPCVMSFSKVTRRSAFFHYHLWGSRSAEILHGHFDVELPWRELAQQLRDELAGASIDDDDLYETIGDWLTTFQKIYAVFFVDLYALVDGDNPFYATKLDSVNIGLPKDIAGQYIQPLMEILQRVQNERIAALYQKQKELEEYNRKEGARLYENALLLLQEPNNKDAIVNLEQAVALNHAPSAELLKKLTQKVIVLKVDETWIYTDENFNKVIEIEFEDALPFGEDGFAFARIDGKYQVINKLGNVVFVRNYTKIEYLGDSTRLLMIKRDNYCALAKLSRGSCTTVEKSTEFKYEQLLIVRHYNYDCTKVVENFINVQINGKWGSINLDGEMIISASYNSSICFKGGFCFVQKENHSIQGFIDRSENWYNLPKELFCMDAYDGIALVKRQTEIFFHYRDEVFALYDIKKQRLITDFVFNYAYINSNFIPVEVGINKGLIDRNGNWILEPEYHVLSYTDGVAHGFPYSGEGKFFLIDSSASEISRSWVYMTNDGRLAIKAPSKCYFVDGSSVPYKQEFVYGRGFSEDLAVIKLSKKYWYVNLEGRTVIEPKYYEDAQDFHGGFAGVKENGKWGYINKLGNLVIPHKFDSFNNFNNNGFAFVKIDEKWGVINTEGEFVIQPQFESSGSLNEKYAYTKEFLCNVETGKIIPYKEFRLKIYV